MTCIVALSKDNKVYIGGERGHSDSHTLASSTQPKVFEVGSYLIGYAGNTGIGQAIVHNFEFPAIKSSNIYKHMTTVFIPSLRFFIKDQDIKLPENEEDNATLALGLKGRVYEVDLSDYQCVEYNELSIGSGSSYAYGSLHSTKNWGNSEKRLKTALESSIVYSPSCTGPIDILSL